MASLCQNLLAFLEQKFCCFNIFIYLLLDSEKNVFMLNYPILHFLRFCVHIKRRHLSLSDLKCAGPSFWNPQFTGVPNLSQISHMRRLICMRPKYIKFHYTVAKTFY